MNTLDYLVNKYNLEIVSNKPGVPQEIANVGRLDLIRWLRELDFKIGLEIGVEAGRYARQICELNSQMKLWGIDPYERYKEYEEYKSQEEMDRIYEVMLKELEAPIKHDRFEIIKKRSQDAVKDFEDESLDFIYIDGNHEFDYPLKDMIDWWPKVKKGGMLAGHDYVRAKNREFTIKDNLKQFTRENSINPWFVLGNYAKQKGVVRDNTRSWVITKQ